MHTPEPHLCGDLLNNYKLFADMCTFVCSPLTSLYLPP